MSYSSARGRIFYREARAFSGELLPATRITIPGLSVIQFTVPGAVYYSVSFEERDSAQAASQCGFPDLRGLPVTNAQPVGADAGHAYLLPIFRVGNFDLHHVVLFGVPPSEHRVVSSQAALSLWVREASEAPQRLHSVHRFGSEEDLEVVGVYYRSGGPRP